MHVHVGVHEEAQRVHGRAVAALLRVAQRRAEVDQVLVHALHVLAALVERRAAGRRRPPRRSSRPCRSPWATRCSRRSRTSRRARRRGRSRSSRRRHHLLLLALRGASAARGTCGAAACGPGGRGARAAPRRGRRWRASPCRAAARASARRSAGRCRTSCAFASASCWTTSTRSCDVRCRRLFLAVGRGGRRRRVLLAPAQRVALAGQLLDVLRGLVALGLQAAHLVLEVGDLGALREAHVQHDLAVAERAAHARDAVGVGLLLRDPGLDRARLHHVVGDRPHQRHVLALPPVAPERRGDRGPELAVEREQHQRAR